MCDDRISKRDFNHGLMNLFGVDASSAIKVNRKLSRVYHLFRDEKEMDVNCSEMFFVFQSIFLSRIVRYNPRKVILTLIESILDGKDETEIDLVKTFKRAILCACICEEEEMETKERIDFWVQRYNFGGHLGMNFIQDLFDLVPSIEIKFCDNVMARLSHQNKMILLEDDEKMTSEIINRVSKKLILKQFIRKMNHQKYYVFQEWYQFTRQSVQGKMLRYRMLYWKVHMVLLWWRRQTIVTKRFLDLEMTVKKSRQHRLCGRIFGLWRRYVTRLIIIRRLEFSETAKNISLALTRIQIASSYYQRRLLLQRWNMLIDMSKKIETFGNWHNKMKRLKYFQMWKHFMFLQRQDIYRNQVNKELMAIKYSQSNK